MAPFFTQPPQERPLEPALIASSRQREAAKLERLLAPASAPDEDLALLAELLSLPAEGRYPPLQLTPARRREKTWAARSAPLLAAESPSRLDGDDGSNVD